VTGREGIPAFSHLFVVVMENLGADAALGVPSIASLAHRYASATAWYAVSHPSLPNYLAFAAGSTFGVSSDCTDCLQTAPNLAGQLAGAGISWGAYFEGMPGSCFLGPQSPDGSYAAKHDPFRYFSDVRSQPALCARLQPLGNLTAALGAGAGAVPRFVWVTPSMCHSGHDCSPTVAGAWLAGFVGAVTTSPAWSQGGALVVTWDEGEGDSAGVSPATGAATGSGGGRVLTLVIAPGIAPGRRVVSTYDHYSLLRTIEDAFGLPYLGDAGAPGSTSMSAFWSGS
jgi:phospholipase C